MRRVAITGLGVVTPAGVGKDPFWSAMTAGRSGVKPISTFDTTNHASKIAGEIRDFNPKDHMAPKTAKRLGRFSQFALAAARLALADAGLEMKDADPLRFGVFCGVAAGDYHEITASVNTYRNKGPGSANPFSVPKVLVNMAASAVAVEFGLMGPNFDVTTACASGAHSLGAALDAIRLGRCDRALAGGSEACLEAMVLDGYDSMRALSRRNDAPEKASRPFDRDRDGFVIAEGAGLLLLEAAELAEARGARIYCELAGWGASCDAYHIVAPHPEGLGAAAAITAALADAGLNAADVAYINAHGTSTDANDRCETLAIKRALGEHAARVAVSSTKSMTGHTLGAAGGIEAAATTLAIRESVAPPTINLENPDPQCDLDYVPQQARPLSIGAALSNSFGFGGHNVVLAFRKW